MSVTLPNIKVDRDWLVSCIREALPELPIVLMDGPALRTEDHGLVYVSSSRFQSVNNFIKTAGKKRSEYNITLFLFEAYMMPANRTGREVEESTDTKPLERQLCVRIATRVPTDELSKLFPDERAS